MIQPLPLRLLPEVFGMCRFGPAADVPDVITRASPCFIARTATELSIIAPLAVLDSPSARFRLFGIDATFGTTESGILKQIIDPLASAQVWVLALGTHDTDYILVREDQAGIAALALQRAGHPVAGTV